MSRFTSHLSTLLFVLTFSSLALAQSPLAFNFQGVARDMGGNPLANKDIGLEFALIQGDPLGPIVYLESHEVTTNSNALFSIAIGRGFIRFGDVNTIDWSDGPFFLRTALDEDGGENYTVVGTSELLSVPFALYAEFSGNGVWEQNDNGISFVDGNVGIGADLPDTKLHINDGDIYLEQSADGIIMKSPNGSCWKQSVSNSGETQWAPIPCPGSTIIGGNPSLLVSPSSLSYELLENQKSINLVNNGDVSFNWSLNYPSTYIAINPSSGNLDPNDSEQLIVTIDRGSMPATINQYEIILTTNAGIQFTIPVTVNNSSSTQSQIIASPGQLELLEGEQATIFLSMQPAAEFEWNVTSKPNWIDITPLSGTINDQIEQLEVSANANATNLNPGAHSGQIQILTNGAGLVKVDVQITVAPHPILEVNPNAIHYALSETEKSYTLSNTGTAQVTWNIQSLPDWINVDIESGNLQAGQNIEINAIADRTGLSVGTEMDQLIIESNSETGDIAIDFTMDVPPLVIMTLSDTTFNFNYFIDEYIFFVKNEGNTDFNWDWDNNSNSFLSATPSTGLIPAGDSIEVTMSIDRSSLATEDYVLEAFITNDAMQSQSLTINVSHYKEEKWLITGRIIDAEYDRNNDVIISVSESPNELRKFNPATNTIETVALNLPPTSVSIAQDGLYAAVGHDGNFAYIDLMTMQIENTFAVTADVFDIILAPNKWVYVMPKADQWARIRCIDLATGAETPHTGNSIRAGSYAKLHPDGNSVYGADNGLSPSDFEKYDISAGTADYLYDSPYHGDFAFSGHVWISEDGQRLFARSRNVFNSSPTESNDMTYNGELEGEGTVSALDFSANAQRVYTVFTTGSIWSGTPSNQVRKYETEFLGFKGMADLPGFLIPDGSGGGNFYDSEGHFGFFNSAGTSFYVIVKAGEGSGAQNEWAIATIIVD